MPEPLRALRLPAACLALLLLALPARAQQAAFDFSIAGIRVGSMGLAFSQSGSAYDATARIDTAGVVGVFVDFFYNGAASGTVASGGKVVPAIFTATSKSPRALRQSRIEWKNGTPVSVSVQPPRETAPEPSEQGGTLDPVSASFRLLRDAPAGSVCNVTVTVFDGSRLQRLEVGPAKRAGSELVCDGGYARLKGEASSMTSRRSFPFQIVFRADASGMARLERITAPTNFGQAVMQRRN